MKAHELISNQISEFKMLREKYISIMKLTIDEGIHLVLWLVSGTAIQQIWSFQWHIQHTAGHIDCIL